MRHRVRSKRVERGNKTLVSQDHCPAVIPHDLQSLVEIEGHVEEQAGLELDCA